MPKKYGTDYCCHAFQTNTKAQTSCTLAGCVPACVYMLTSGRQIWVHVLAHIATHLEIETNQKMWLSNHRCPKANATAVTWCRPAYTFFSWNYVMWGSAFPFFMLILKLKKRKRKRMCLAGLKHFESLSFKLYSKQIPPWCQARSECASFVGGANRHSSWAVAAACARRRELARAGNRTCH